MGSRKTLDKAREALDQARQFATEGKFEEALAKHVWFHNHALEVQRSYYGVRLSYALGYWVELGKQYPKATEVLRAIRDEKTSRLLAGETDRELFHDVKSINAHLKEAGATADLFRGIEASRPEFAASVYDLAGAALIGAQGYELAGKYLGEPFARFDKAKADYEEGIEYAMTVEKKQAAPTRAAFEGIFERDIVLIIAVLAKTGRQQVAQEIQTRALAMLDSPIIRDVSIE